MHWSSRSRYNRVPRTISRQRAGECDAGSNRLSGTFDHRLERRRQLRNLNLKPPPASTPTPPFPLLQRRFFFIVRKHNNFLRNYRKREMSETLPIGDLLNLTKLGRSDLPTREVASSSPGALSMSMLVAAEVGLERHRNWLVRTSKYSVDL